MTYLSFIRSMGSFRDKKYRVTPSSQDDKNLFHPGCYIRDITGQKKDIITDNTDWTTADMIEANPDRRQVEDRFRLSNNDELVKIRPVRHWTDSKIKCHLFTCVTAMTYLRRIELKPAQRGIQRTAAAVMEDIRKLLYYYPGI